MFALPTSYSDPVYANADHSLIDVQAMFGEAGPYPYTVSKNDEAQAAIYAEIIAQGIGPYVAPVPTLAQRAGAAMLAGLTIALSGSVTLAATVFPTDPLTQNKLAAVATTINTTGYFPGGVTTYPMKDATADWHVFTLDQWKAVAAAIAAYAAALDLIIDGNPLNALALPESSVSLTV